jgi:hypothetical protein
MELAMSNLKSRIKRHIDRSRSKNTGNDRPERRVGFSPVPDGIEYLLTEHQAACLSGPDSRLSIAFVRSQERFEPLIVVVDGVDDSYGILSDEGHVHYDSALRLRT